MSTFITRTGNPSMLVAKTHKSPSYAKKAMRKPIDELRTWATKFNLTLAAECDTLVIELGDLNLEAIPHGQSRRWELKDQPSGVTLVVEVEKT